MNWLIFVLITILFDSIRIFIDNYASDYYFKGKFAVAQKLFYGYAFIIFSLILIFLMRENLAGAPLFPLLIFFISGFITSLAGIPYYKALELDDSTNLGIFIQLAPVLYLILGWFFLDQSFSPIQLVAFILILSAPVLIVLSTKKRNRNVKIKAVFYSFIYVFIAIIANLIFVKENSTNENLNFITEMSFVFLGKGIGNLVIIYARPKWRKRFLSVLKSSKKKVLLPLFCSGFFGITKDFTYRAALTLAPSVALASAASDSATPIVIFFMGILLTLIWPKFGREKLDKKTIQVHLIATVLVVIGIVLLQF